MVRHVILWQIKDEYSAEEKEAIKKGVKEGLESLVGKVPGLTEAHVQCVGLASSSADLMLDSTFENEEALKAYKDHPEHVAVADGKVRPHMKTRVCLDYVV